MLFMLNWAYTACSIADKRTPNRAGSLMNLHNNRGSVCVGGVGGVEGGGGIDPERKDDSKIYLWQICHPSS